MVKANIFLQAIDLDKTVDPEQTEKVKKEDKFNRKNCALI